MTSEQPMVWRPTRTSGLARLERFVPVSRDDEYRRVSGQHERSGLSPYLAHRLVLDSEIARAVTKQRGPDAAHAFLTELARHTYYRGWLAHRPLMWADYRAALADGLGRVEQSAATRRPYLEAVLGETGIEGFDSWSHELVERGYLNHRARLAFASIWVFTLKLPWVLGSDFFNRHLLDGDIAANVSSWREVAGLHTGVPYVVSRAELTDLFAGPLPSSEVDLTTEADALVDPKPRSARPLEPTPRVAAGGATGAVLTSEDLCPEASPLRALELQSVMGGWAKRIGDAYHLSARVIDFRREAIGDALERARAHLGVRTGEPREREWIEDVIEWAQAEQLDRVVALQPDIGPWRDLLGELATALGRRDIGFSYVQREWDRLLFPAASGEFSPFMDHFWSVRDKLVAVD